ncbi:MAG: hypothetical protein J1F16_00660 [Muribaculaceae bacterium]|nr:hypothetical protein [Muribaculaceae bacterium]
MKKAISIGLLLGTLIVGNSCVDDKYDLDNLDATTAVKLENLTVPVRLETITLDDVLDISDESIIKKKTGKNGMFYAIETGGSFQAQPINVKEVEVLDYATISNLPLVVNNGEITPGEVEFSYLLGSGQVDDAIIRVTKLWVSDSKPLELGLTISSPMGTSIPQITNFVISIPETFAATYKGQTVINGEVNVDIVNGRIDSPIMIQVLDFGDGVYRENGNLDFTGMIGVKSGTVAAQNTTLEATFTMSPFNANKISGEIEYDVESPDFSPVELNDIPDFLMDGDSKLIISNPQVYINLENPVDAPFTGTLKILPYGNNGADVIIPLDPFVFNTVIAADIDNLFFTMPQGATIQQATDLQNVLYGEGIPQSLDIDLANPVVKGDINEVELGSDLMVSGDYTFFAPLAFESQSQILYQKKETDFFDGANDVNITKLVLSAYPTSKIPFNVNLTVYPLDKEGNRIKGARGNEISASGMVKAYANGSEQLVLSFDQPFTGLDGVEYIVTVNNMDGTALSPDQTLTLDKIRATITGSYIIVDDKYEEDYK